MMGLFHKKSRWDRVAETLPTTPVTAAKSGLTAFGALVAMSVASAAVSKLRRSGTQ